MTKFYRTLKTDSLIASTCDLPSIRVFEGEQISGSEPARIRLFDGRGEYLKEGATHTFYDTWEKAITAIKTISRTKIDVLLWRVDELTENMVTITVKGEPK